MIQRGARAACPPHNPRAQCLSSLWLSPWCTRWMQGSWRSSIVSSRLHSRRTGSRRAAPRAWPVAVTASGARREDGMCCWQSTMSGSESLKERQRHAHHKAVLVVHLLSGLRGHHSVARQVEGAKRLVLEKNVPELKMSAGARLDATPPRRARRPRPRCNTYSRIGRRLVVVDGVVHEHKPPFSPVLRGQARASQLDEPACRRMKRRAGA